MPKPLPNIQDRCVGLLTRVNQLRGDVEKLHDSILIKTVDKMTELVVELMYQHADGMGGKDYGYKNRR